jgi:hypothetical protein
MAWTWQYAPAEAEAEPAGSFSSQSDAENWIGEYWRELAAVGVTSVTLLRDDKRIYGPMQLA